MDSQVGYGGTISGAKREESRKGSQGGGVPGGEIWSKVNDPTIHPDQSKLGSALGEKESTSCSTRVGKARSEQNVVTPELHSPKVRRNYWRLLRIVARGSKCLTWGANTHGEQIGRREETIPRPCVTVKIRGPTRTRGSSSGIFKSTNKTIRYREQH